MDELFMEEALAEARLAGQAGDVPVGAVIVQNGQIVARAHNEKEAGAMPCPTRNCFASKRPAGFYKGGVFRTARSM